MVHALNLYGHDMAFQIFPFGTVVLHINNLNSIKLLWEMNKCCLPPLFRAVFINILNVAVYKNLEFAIGVPAISNTIFLINHFKYPIISDNVNVVLYFKGYPNIIYCRIFSK